MRHTASPSCHRLRERSLCPALAKAAHLGRALACWQNLVRGRSSDLREEGPTTAPGDDHPTSEPATTIEQGEVDQASLERGSDQTERGTGQTGGYSVFVKDCVTPTGGTICIGGVTEETGKTELQAKFEEKTGLCPPRLVREGHELGESGPASLQRDGTVHALPRVGGGAGDQPGGGEQGEGGELQLSGVRLQLRGIASPEVSSRARALVSARATRSAPSRSRHAANKGGDIGNPVWCRWTATSVS